MGLKQSRQSEHSPANLTFYQCRDILSEIIELFQNNRYELMLDLKIDQSSFKYLQKDWKRSNIHGTVRVYSPKQANDTAAEAILLDMEQVFKICVLLRHFRKANSSVTPTPTPNQLQEQQQKQCCICCERKSSTVLPCSHSFCAKCTSQYIIEQQLRKCPLCRMEFAGNKEAVQKTFYQIIEEDKLVYDEARTIILDHLKKYNTRIVDNIKNQISQLADKLK